MAVLSARAEAFWICPALRGEGHRSHRVTERDSWSAPSGRVSGERGGNGPLGAAP